MNLTLQQWDALQERAVNPFRSNESNAVNRLTRVVTLGNDYVIKESYDKDNAELVDYQTVRLISGHYIKDDVYIHFKEDVDLNFNELESYLVSLDQAMNMAGTYRIGLHYVYSESLPHPVATFKIMKPNEALTAHVVLVCNAVVEWNASLNIFEIKSINFDGVPYLYINMLLNGGGVYNTNALFESKLPGLGRYLRVDLGKDVPEYKAILGVRKADGNTTPDIGELWYSKIDDRVFKIFNSGVNKVDYVICELSSPSGVSINPSDILIDDVPNTDPATITFNVTSGGTPITDATITFAGMTNSPGDYIFGVFQETYTYVIVADGYNVKTGTIEVSGNETINVDMSVTTDHVEFSILVGSAPFAGATITYNNVTNAAGDYGFDVVPGTYTYTISAPGYEDVTGTQPSNTTPSPITLVEAEEQFNVITQPDEPGDHIYEGTLGETNVFVLYYKSDPFGAQANFGNVTIRNYNHAVDSKDILLLVDKNNTWGTLTNEVDSAFTSSIQKPTPTDSLITIRPDPENPTGTNSILIEGAVKTAFGTKLTTLSTVNYKLARLSDVTNLNDYISSIIA